MSGYCCEQPLPGANKTGVAHRLALLVAAAGVCVVMLSGKALALDICPADMKPGNPRVTHSHHGDFRPPGKGIPLDTLVSDHNWNADKSAVWQISDAVGIQDGWTRTYRAEDFDINAIHGTSDFSFWMPDKRYPERRLNFPMGTEPKVCEHGRPRPGEDDYLVRFSFGAISRVPILKTPEQEWSQGYFPRGDIRYNLIKPKTHIYDINKTTGKIFRESYYHPVGHPYQVHIGCYLWKGDICTGNLYFPEEKLSLFIQFGNQYVSVWQKNVIAALELLKSWQAETPETLSDPEIDQIIQKVRGDSDE